MGARPPAQSCRSFFHTTYALSSLSFFRINIREISVRLHNFKHSGSFAVPLFSFICIILLFDGRERDKAGSFRSSGGWKRSDYAAGAVKARSPRLASNEPNNRPSWTQIGTQISALGIHNACDDSRHYGHSDRRAIYAF